jgi:uncharacterized membrane protein YbhN (UPF0104 family)
MKKIIVNLLKVLVTILILYLIFKKFQIGWSDVRNAFTQGNLWWFAASIGTQLVAILFSIFRWTTLLRAQALVVPLPHLVRTYMVGRFLGTFTPTGLGLEAYKAYDVARYTQKAPESVAVVLVEKILTILALSLLVVLSLFFVHLAKLFLLVFLAFFLFLFLLALLLIVKSGWLEALLRFNFPLKGKIEKPLREAIQACGRYREKRASLAIAVICGVIVYFGLFSTFYTNGLALRIPSPTRGQLYTLKLTEPTKEILVWYQIEFIERGATSEGSEAVISPSGREIGEVYLSSEEMQTLQRTGIELTATSSPFQRKGLSLTDIYRVGPLTQIATMIPLSIAGIGLREGAFVGLLRSAKIWVGPKTVLAATMWYFVSISINIIGAIIFLTRRTDYRRMLAERKGEMMK